MSNTFKYRVMTNGVCVFYSNDLTDAYDHSLEYDNDQDEILIEELKKGKWKRVKKSTLESCMCTDT